jgi:hypothetical protein
MFLCPRAGSPAFSVLISLLVPPKSRCSVRIRELECTYNLRNTLKLRLGNANRLGYSQHGEYAFVELGLSPTDSTVSYQNPDRIHSYLEFTKVLEDAMQLSLRKWVGLPLSICGAHVPLLQHFEQFVELQEAVQTFGSLSQTNAGNLEKKSAELKMVLEAWRERLANLYDDIAIWSDLVAWRQNISHAIKNAYIPLIQNTNRAKCNRHAYI